jgi:hypothetical protein
MKIEPQLNIEAQSKNRRGQSNLGRAQCFAAAGHGTPLCGGLLRIPGCLTMRPHRPHPRQQRRKRMQTFDITRGTLIH